MFGSLDAHAGPRPAPGIDPPLLERIAHRAHVYRDRYALDALFEKRVDNYGRGDAHLAGTRNVRVVLHGVLYRGGANNLYASDPAEVRKNSNPLPVLGLENLCAEGFGESIYLYPTRFHTAPASVTCSDRNTARPAALRYRQLSAFLEPTHREILGEIRAVALDPARGPIYAHCWNGWHASGYVAATALVQWCRFTPEEALAYWRKGTDGMLSGYASHEQRILRFRRDPSLDLPDDVAEILCPQLGSAPKR